MGHGVPEPLFQRSPRTRIISAVIDGLCHGKSGRIAELRPVVEDRDPEVHTAQQGDQRQSDVTAADGPGQQTGVPR